MLLLQETDEVVVGVKDLFLLELIEKASGLLLDLFLSRTVGIFDVVFKSFGNQVAGHDVGEMVFVQEQGR